MSLRVAQGATRMGGISPICHGGSLAEDLSFQARFKLPRRAPAPAAVEQELCRFGTGGPGRGRCGLMDISSSWNDKGVHFKLPVPV